MHKKDIFDDVSIPTQYNKPLSFIKAVLMRNSTYLDLNFFILYKNPVTLIVNVTEKYKVT